MKKLYVFLCLVLGFVAVAQFTTLPQAIRIVADKVNPAFVIHGTTNQIASYFTIKTENGQLFNITSNGVPFSSATTNQMLFAGTNSAPTNTSNPVVWISVQVNGDTNAYRLPLYK